jgi:hypothetical protein
MKYHFSLRRAAAALALGFFFLSGLPPIATATESQDNPKTEAVTAFRVIPFELERSIPLSVQSPAVEWKGNTFHLVKLGTIQFELDPKNSQLIAVINAGVTTFDNVDYDISAAVFDASGKLLGTARAQCKVQREWLGHVLTMAATISLDFGTSLDYPQAKSFMLSVSRQRVTTPDQWQK